MPRSKTGAITLEEAKARFEEWRRNRKGKASIPDELWASFNSGTYVSMAEVFDFARRVEVHPAIVAGRVRHATGNYRLLSHFVGTGAVRKQLFEAQT